MILKHIPVLLTSAMLLFSCSSNDDPKSGGETEEHVYSLTAVLDNVKIRVDESFSLEMHIDTDEANACQVRQGDFATIIQTI